MLIVANWKAYVEDVAKAKALAASAARLALKGKHEIVLAPAFPFLALLAPKSKPKSQQKTKSKTLAKTSKKPLLGAQDVSTSESGAHTGEVTAAQLAGVGASYVIVGHSERRAAGETDALIAEKAKRAFMQKITPILCVGEKERDQDAKYLAVLREQIGAVFSKLSPKERLSIVIAYEPVWAIGRSALQAIQPADLAEMVLYIRKLLAEYMPGKGAARVRILYGGSVEPANVRALADDGGIDGFLIGHASADAATFAALVKELG